MAQDKISGKRILLVEDDPSARQSINLLLRIDRHAVTEAENGKKALELVAQQEFDLVILDYAMPGMLGGEAAIQIKRLVPSMPILMVTAYFEKMSGLGNSVDAVLGKPFAVSDLRREVASLTKPQTLPRQKAEG